MMTEAVTGVIVTIALNVGLAYMWYAIGGVHQRRKIWRHLSEMPTVDLREKAFVLKILLWLDKGRER